MRRSAIVVACVVLASCRAWSSQRRDEPTAVAQHVAENGVSWEDLHVGTGAEVRPDSRVSVNYVGRLADGTAFDSSFDRGVPSEFELGAGRLIPGLEQGLQGMRVGGRRLVTVPPELGWGAEGSAGVIPPNATLVFEIELLEVSGE